MFQFSLLLTLILSVNIYASCENPCKKNVENILNEASRTISNNIQNTKHIQEVDPAKFMQDIEKTTKDVLLPLIDINNMIKHIIGRYHWKMARKVEKERFHALFKKVLLHEYTIFILHTHNSAITFNKSRYSSDDEYKNIRASATVNEKPIDIVFYTKCSCDDKASWKVIDITVDNISYLDQYRLKYAATVRIKGLKGLNDKLEEGLKEGKI